MASKPRDGEPRAGRCVLVGRPNVGKSTLLNRLVGQKLAITTSRPGTTRACLLGVYHANEPPTQIAFVDTPGTYAPKSSLGRVLLEEARAGVDSADLALFLTDVDRTQSPDAVLAEDERALGLVRDAGVPVVLAINKVDRLRSAESLLPILAAYEKVHPFAALVPISAIDGTNIEALLDELRKLLPTGVLYDEDFVTDRPERFLAAELVREAALENLRAELPHGIAVVMDQYTELPNLVRIAATLIVERDSHKRIVVGKSGAMIKRIGTEARVQIEALVRHKVHLALWVKVEKDWTQNPAKAKALVGNGGT